MASITITLQGKEVGHCNFEASPVTVGSGQASDVVLQSDEIEGQHCKFEKSGNNFIITNLSTSTGTLLNSTEVNQGALYTGDIIAVGEYEILFVGVGQRKGVPETVQGTYDHDLTVVGDNAELAGGIGYKKLLLKIQGKNVDETVPIEEPYYIIGASEEAAIQLKGWGIAKNHAVIIKGTADVRIVNVSDKKMLLNGQLAEAKITLSTNDTVQIGPYSITLKHG